LSISFIAIIDLHSKATVDMGSRRVLKHCQLNEDVMSDKQLASEACDEGFKDGIQKMVEVLLQGWIIAKTQTEKKQVVQRFQNGLGMYKEAYKSAQLAIDEVFT
jgi:hypothetical protein